MSSVTRPRIRVDRSSRRVLDSGRVDGRTSFFVSGDIVQDERQAIPIAAERAAAQLVSQISEGF